MFSLKCGYGAVLATNFSLRLLRVAGVIQTLVLAACGSLFGEFANGDDLTSSRLLQKACDAVESVQCLHFRYDARTFPRSSDRWAEAEAFDGVYRNEQGEPVEYKVERWWDAQGLHRLDVRQLMFPAGANEMYYDHYVMTVDGDRYIGYSYREQRGKIRYQVHDSFPGYSVINLLGYGQFGFRRHLTRELLNQDQFSASPEVVSSGQLVVSGRLKPADNSHERNIRITIDPDQGFLPVRFDVEYAHTQTKSLEIEVSEIRPVGSILVPVAGTAQLFSIKEHYPNGLTIGDINAMSADEYARIKDQVKQTAEPLGDAHVVSTEIISVNRVEPRQFFTLEVPADIRMFDFTRDDPRPKSPVH